MSGTVRSTDGEPIAGALLDIWQADDDGFYDVQYAGLDEAAAAATCSPPTRAATGSGPSSPRPTRSRPTARWAACSRHQPQPDAPGHVHFKVTAPGYETLITHVFDETTSTSTPTRSSACELAAATFEHHDPARADGREMTEPWRSTQFDLILAP